LGKRLVLLDAMILFCLFLDLLFGGPFRGLLPSNTVAGVATPDFGSLHSLELRFLMLVVPGDGIVAYVVIHDSSKL